jgi:hypothetical protein
MGPRQVIMWSNQVKMHAHYINTLINILRFIETHMDLWLKTMRK